MKLVHRIRDRCASLFRSSTPAAGAPGSRDKKTSSDPGQDDSAPMSVDLSRNIFFKSLPTELVIRFLYILLHQCDLKTFSNFIDAFPHLSRWVVHIREGPQRFSNYNIDDEEIFTSAVTRITFAKFEALHPTDDLRRRPVRILSFGCAQTYHSYNPMLTKIREMCISKYLIGQTTLVIRASGQHQSVIDEVSQLLGYLKPPSSVGVVILNSWAHEVFDGLTGDLLSQMVCDQYVARRPPIPLSKRRVVEITNLASRSAPSLRRLSFRVVSCGMLRLNFGRHCNISKSKACNPHILQILHTPLSQTGVFHSLQVSFSCSQFPVIAFYDPDETDEMNGIKFMPYQLILINEKWSESCPFGKTCKHAEEKLCDSSSWMVSRATQPITRTVHGGRQARRPIRPRSVEFIGLPDSGIRLLDFTFVEEFTWMRLSPVRKSLREQPPLVFPNLLALKLVSLIRKGEALPRFKCPKLVKLDLIALPGSSEVWDLGHMLNPFSEGVQVESRPCKIQIGGPMIPDTPLLSTHLASVACKARSLTVSGICPLFVHDHEGFTLPFRILSTLCIDVSDFPFVEGSPDNTMEIVLESRRFPYLSTLRLTALKQASNRFRGPFDCGTSLSLHLPVCITAVAISSLIKLSDLSIKAGGCELATKSPVNSHYAGTESVWKRDSVKDTFYFAESRASVDPLADYLETISRG